MIHSGKIRILYLIQLPPPVHGVSTINQYVYNSEFINKDIEKSLLEIKFSNTISDLQKLSFFKIMKAIVLFFRLFIRIIRFKPDFVYFSIMPVGRGFYRDFFYAILIKLLGVKIIYHLHNRGIRKRSEKRSYRILYRMVFNNSFIIHLSQGLIDSAFSLLKLKNTRFFVAGNGIEVIEKNQREIKNDETLQLLFVSHLIKGKGIFIVLEALHRLKDEYPTLYLTVAGETWRKETDREIKEYIRNKGLEKKVTLCGPLYGEELYKKYRQADIFVFPTFFEQECFPLVLLQAMQFGLPVVTTRQGAIPEIIDDEVNGLLANPNDLNDFTNKFKLLINNKELRYSFGEEARRKFLSNYTIYQFEQNMLKIIKEIE